MLNAARMFVDDAAIQGKEHKRGPLGLGFVLRFAFCCLLALYFFQVGGVLILMLMRVRAECRPSHINGTLEKFSVAWLSSRKSSALYNRRNSSAVV
jgi:hypothetical protein